MKNVIRTLALTALLAGYGLANTACSGESTTSAGFSLPSSGTGGGDGDTGDNGNDDVVGDKTATAFAVHANYNSAAETYLHKDSAAWTEKCEIPKETVLSTTATQAQKNISCTLDINEFDLYFYDFQLTNPVPANLCEFTIVKPFWFYSYEPGDGPTNTISWNVNSSGAIYGYADTSGKSTLSSGAPHCKYDYSGSGGPNCCVGSYAATVTTYDSNGVGTVDTVTGDWGGAYGNCAAGPGKLFATNASGYPIPKAYNTLTGNTLEMTFSSPIAQLLASNMFFANYWVATTPADAIQYPVYFWGCYDQNMERKASITLRVREWNTHDQFALKSNSANPDVGGNETNGEPNNDKLDWDDLTNALKEYPGGLL